MKFFIALLLYRLLFLLLLPLVILVLLVRSRTNVFYRQRLLERLGRVPSNLLPGGIVVHAASVGEVLALKSFVDNLLLTKKHLPITFTTFTPTGSAQVIKLFGNQVQHCYFPLDNILSNTLFLHKLKPKMVVFMETELWPSFVRQAKQRQCKLLLINGRLSNNSVVQYSKISWLISATLKQFDQILSQSEDNYQNFIALGATVEQCEISGNLKYDLSITQAIIDKQIELSKYLPENRPLWVIASTHPGDEEIALSAFKHILTQCPNMLMVIVPRHPERFEKAYNLCLSHGFATEKRSDATLVDDEKQIWLLDSLGELMAMYALSSIVTMGGSFSEVGGHNPLEPALFKKPIIVGPYMNNFKEVLSQLSKANGIAQLPLQEDYLASIADSLAAKVCQLYQDNDLSKHMGEQALAVVLENQGATEKSISHVKYLLTD